MIYVRVANHAPSVPVRTVELCLSHHTQHIFLCTLTVEWQLQHMTCSESASKLRGDIDPPLPPPAPRSPAGFHRVPGHVPPPTIRRSCSRLGRFAVCFNRYGSLGQHRSRRPSPTARIRCVFLFLLSFCVSVCMRLCVCVCVALRLVLLFELYIIYVLLLKNIYINVFFFCCFGIVWYSD